MIITSASQKVTTKTEIIDVINKRTCLDVDDFPLWISGSAVGANLKGTPVVCGSDFVSTLADTYKCYKFTINGGWQEFVSLNNNKRDSAAGIVYQNKFHIFGGWDGLKHLKTSQIISADGIVSDGPDLPTSISHHAITTINSTVSIISGGTKNIWDTTSATSKTWYYNHKTKNFTSGPTLREGRRNHGSATIIDKMTKEKIPVVTGGYKYSTELLIKGQWQTGII